MKKCKSCDLYNKQNDKCCIGKQTFNNYRARYCHDYSKHKKTIEESIKDDYPLFCTQCQKQILSSVIMSNKKNKFRFFFHLNNSTNYTEWILKLKGLIFCSIECFNEYFLELFNSYENKEKQKKP